MTKSKKDPNQNNFIQRNPKRNQNLDIKKKKNVTGKQYAYKNNTRKL